MRSKMKLVWAEDTYARWEPSSEKVWQAYFRLSGELWRKEDIKGYSSEDSVSTYQMKNGWELVSTCDEWYIYAPGEKK
jgi:hypothetical protein